MDRHVATVEFTHDGVWRPVYEQPDGRQYVDVDGVPVYGTWFIPRDEPQPDAVVVTPGGITTDYNSARRSETPLDRS
jgi:hypothetical protein